MTLTDFVTRMFGSKPADPRPPRRAPRMTTPEERAPLCAAYAAARAYIEANPGADSTNDGIIQAAVIAYETTKTGGSYLAHRNADAAAAPGSVAVGGDLNGAVSTRVTLAAPNRKAVLGPWLRQVGDHAAYRNRRTPDDSYNIALPREIANEIETMLIHIEGTSKATGTNINALRRIVSDAIADADKATDYGRRP